MMFLSDWHFFFFLQYVDKQLRANWAADSQQALPHVAPQSDRPLNQANDTTAPPVENPYSAHLFLEREEPEQVNGK